MFLQSCDNRIASLPACFQQSSSIRKAMNESMNDAGICTRPERGKNIEYVTSQPFSALHR